MNTPQRLLIADDEAPLRDWLRRRLAEVAPQAQIVAEVADGVAALAAIEAHVPDVAFLDIRMPGLSGLEVAARAAGRCRIVFVTAYDEFAVVAFERAAVDYLLKPVTTERLAQTWARLAVPAPEAQLAGLLRELLAAAPPAVSTRPAPLRWLRLGLGETVHLVDAHTVDYFEAADKYTTVHAEGKALLMRTGLGELEQQLDPERFWRIHRSIIVRVDAIDSVTRDLMGRVWVKLCDSGKPLPVSRTYAHLFNRM
jgi:DNA-binding LytR/AlgR family response regulator